jgi:hypothetical protein
MVSSFSLCELMLLESGNKQEIDLEYYDINIKNAMSMRRTAPKLDFTNLDKHLIVLLAEESIRVAFS